MPPPRNIESHPVATPLLGSESLKGERSELRAISNRARRAGRLRFSVLLISPLGGIPPPSSNLLWESARRGRPDPQRRITAPPTSSLFLLQSGGRWQRLPPVALNLAAREGAFHPNAQLFGGAAAALQYSCISWYLDRKDSRYGLFR